MIRFISFFTRALTTESAPRRVAMGFAMGIAIGLVPKGNLTAVFLIGMLFAMRVNLISALASGVVCSLLAPLGDPLFHAIGTHLLMLPRPQGFYSRVWQTPLVPWTQLNNTVVLGSFVVGLLQLFPMARIMTPYFKSRLPRWST